ncbi:TNF receptor-associated factor 6-like [Amblyomma americanum]
MLCTLVGFSAALDWRPLRFVKPIPPNRVCSACGLLRRKTVFFSCAHTLCESCYKQCTELGLHACPLDGREFRAKDVDWREFPAAELLKRDVRCWNEEHGCQCVTPASGIAQHFLRECGHQSVSCPKCSATVYCSGVIVHLKSAFCNFGTAPASDSKLNSGLENERAVVTNFRRCLEKQAAEVNQFLVRILGDITTQGDRLKEISRGINSSGETLRQELADRAKQNEKSSAQIMRAIEASNRQLELLSGSIDALNPSGTTMRLEETRREEVANVVRESQHESSDIATAFEAARAAENEDREEALDYIQNVSRRSEQCVSFCMFLVRNVKSLMETAMREGLAIYDSQQVYLRGYCISPGVFLEKFGKALKLKTKLRLHKGDMDDSLVWPFEHTIKLSIVHPKYAIERAVHNKPLLIDARYQKPTTASNDAVMLSMETLDMKRLISDGYVEEDELRIRFELLP